MTYFLVLGGMDWKSGRILVGGKGGDRWVVGVVAAMSRNCFGKG